ncbi:MAG: exopolysaccharide biosynthesis polyprenyl glycosylphosphotransferase [Thermobispora bispora]|nr:exopolysaccharide biosynthesis polyprenyl glycosylphosphotransferase [Thermobispora bispora]MBX6166169.1 exopolysaccharide biosynthesis polyprenyl glycosylphosphotransferase [Thermobispora bispora]QSI49425.1 exopolysaccharide biosynthesis polyprenyl glycosylphosphotransferase [Thermobispora bispora]
MLDGDAPEVTLGPSRMPPPGRAAGRAAWIGRCRRQAAVADMLSALLAGGVAFGLRFGEIDAETRPYAVLSGVLPLLWIGAASLSQAYDPRVFGGGVEEFRRVARCGCAAVAAVALAVFLTGADLDRGYVLIALPLATLLALCARYGLRRRLYRRRARTGEGMRRTVAVGHPPAVTELIRRLRRERHHGLEVVAVCLPTQAAPGETRIEGVPVLGDVTDVPLVVEQAGAEVVAVLACPELDGGAIRRLAWRLEHCQAELMVAPALLDAAGPRTVIRPVAGLPLLRVERPRLAGANRLLKDAFDRVVAALALLVLAPLLVVIAVAVRASGPGPVLTRRQRVGRDGRVFTLLRFRTVRQDTGPGADGQPGDGPGPAAAADPGARITPLGARLRRHSLDELPQFLNVLRGDMSLVGPRAPLPGEVARYGDDVRRRLLIRPGMTGLWQVAGNSALSWEELVSLDLRYVENWSLMLDLQILWKTWTAVVLGGSARNG